MCVAHALRGLWSPIGVKIRNSVVMTAHREFRAAPLTATCKLTALRLKVVVVQLIGSRQFRYAPLAGRGLTTKFLILTHKERTLWSPLVPPRHDWQIDGWCVIIPNLYRQIPYRKIIISWVCGFNRHINIFNSREVNLSII